MQPLAKTFLGLAIATSGTSAIDLRQSSFHARGQEFGETDALQLDNVVHISRFNLPLNPSHTYILENQPVLGDVLTHVNYLPLEIETLKIINALDAARKIAFEACSTKFPTHGPYLVDHLNKILEDSGGNSNLEMLI